MSEPTYRPENANGPGAPDVSGPTEPDEIRADIEATRDQLTATVAELSHRLDVPTRAKESAAQAKDTAVETYRENPPVVIGVGIALIAGIVALLVWRRKTRAERVPHEAGTARRGDPARSSSPRRPSTAPAPAASPR